VCYPCGVTINDDDDDDDDDLDIGQQHLRETDVELLKTETNVGIEFFYEPNCK